MRQGDKLDSFSKSGLKTFENQVIDFGGLHVLYQETARLDPGLDAALPTHFLRFLRRSFARGYRNAREH